MTDHKITQPLPHCRSCAPARSLHTAYWQACALAVTLWQQHYRDTLPNFTPADALPAVLTQLDDMVAGLPQPSEAATEPPTAPASPRTLDYEAVKAHFFSLLEASLQGRGRMESAFFHTAEWVFRQGQEELEALRGQVAGAGQYKSLRHKAFLLGAEWAFRQAGLTVHEDGLTVSEGEIASELAKERS